MTVRPSIEDRRPRFRSVGLALIACLASGLAACSASNESSSEQLPIGPEPSITVLLRVDGDAPPTVQLIGTGTTQGALDAAAGAVARVAFPTAQVGTPVLATTTDPALTVATVPVQLPTDAMTVDLNSDQIRQATKLIHPKAIAVWVCTDDRRSLSVDSTAPGAVSRDVVSGQCQVAGSTLAQDSVTWTAKASVGAVERPSTLPFLIGALAVVALVVLAVWLVRSRRIEQPIDTGPPMPPAPPTPPVH